VFDGGRWIGRLTEVQLLLIEDVFVEEDDTGAHGNPDTARALSAPIHFLCLGRDSHNIESGVDAALRRSRLLERRVDGGQDRLGLLRSLDLTGGSFLLHCAERVCRSYESKKLVHWTVMDQRTGCTEQRGGKEWETEGSNGNLGCEVGTSFDVCGAHNFDPLDCSVRKLGRPLLCKWSRPFETVDTRFNQELSPGTRNHIHSITHDRSRYHDDLNTSGFIFEHCAIVCIDMMSCEIPLRRLGTMWYTVNGCCAAQFISFS
jgi:hypothetical protein